jgi:hypothetical protein
MNLTRPVPYRRSGIIDPVLDEWNCWDYGGRNALLERGAAGIVESYIVPVLIIGTPPFPHTNCYCVVWEWKFCRCARTIWNAAALLFLLLMCNDIPRFPTNMGGGLVGGSERTESSR